MSLPEEHASRTKLKSDLPPASTTPHREPLNRVAVHDQILENLTLIELAALSRLDEDDPAASGIKRLVGDIIFAIDELVIVPDESAPGSGRVAVNADTARSRELRVRELEDALIEVAAEEECMAEELAEVARDAERCGTVSSGQSSEPLWDTIMWHGELSKRMQEQLSRAFAHTNRIRTLANVYSRKRAAA